MDQDLARTFVGILLMAVTLVIAGKAVQQIQIVLDQMEQDIKKERPWYE